MGAVTHAALLLLLAHHKLVAPADWLVVDSLYGDPIGGTQKTGPCGGGTQPTNTVTTVTVGQKLTVRWTETVGHPGHYRIGIAANRGAFVTPTAVVTNNDCKSAPIQSPAVAPILMDGVYPHSVAMQ